MNTPRETSAPAKGQTQRLAIDVGGTFTDVALLDEANGEVRFEKTSTTPQDPAVGVIDAIVKANVALDTISYFVHGTTLALNALLTRSGASVGLVTTHGFRDVYELGRTDREINYDLTYRKPPSLVPRRLAFEVDERMTFEGVVARPFDRDQAREVAMQIKAAGVSAVAVCFLHSYANPSHEVLMGEVLREVDPDLEVTLSHRLVREYREYERTSTSVVDAYIKPIVRGYLDHLSALLKAGQFVGRFLVIRSGGGAMTLETAMEQPVHTVFSGPAGGVIGAAAFAALVSEPNLITVDMGGTSLDASLIIEGAPITASEATFEGQSIALQSLNIKTIGAGGGSIAWIDEGGHMQVGPQSAGALPGPAGYGRGGMEATVTDAALLIGYMGEDTALGGELTLIRDLAQEAIGRLAMQLGLAPMTVADGIVEMAVTRVTGAVREITVERGHDPSDFALLAYGGGGGLIAGDVARELGIPRVIVPPGPGAFSAFGMLLTDVIHDFAQTRVGELQSIGTETLSDVYRELEERGKSALEADRFRPATMMLERSADLRFAGQEHTVSVPVPSGEISDTSLTALAEDFARRHEERYGHRMDDAVELVTARLRAAGAVPRPQLPMIGPGEPDRARIGRRNVYRGGGDPVEYEVLRREHLGRGFQIDGPVIVEEHTATTVVGPRDRMQVGPYGELVITVWQGEGSRQQSRAEALTR